jgi:hypothetical protein
LRHGGDWDHKGLTGITDSNSTRKALMSVIDIQPVKIED